jgi:hypothetical protein
MAEQGNWSCAPTLPTYDPDDIDDVPGAEAEAAEDEIVDRATAAALGDARRGAAAANAQLKLKKIVIARIYSI